jgi:hypothetical protein
VTKTVEVTAHTDIRESRRRMVSIPPGTHELTDGRAQKVVDAGNGAIVTPEKAPKPDAGSTTGKPGTTTAHDNVKG